MAFKRSGTLGNKDISTKRMEGRDDLRQTGIQPEIQYRIMLSQIGNGQKIEIVATEQQCCNLRQRLGIPAVGTLACLFVLERISADIVRASGHLMAQVSQTCIITNEPVDETIDEHFILRFVPQGQIPANADGPLDWESLLVEAEDDIPYDGRVIDLGEAVCEQLALCLNPWPRKAGSGLERFVEQLPDDGTSAGERAGLAGLQEKGKRNPFMGLASLKPDCGETGSEKKAEKDRTEN